MLFKAASNRKAVVAVENTTFLWLERADIVTSPSPGVRGKPQQDAAHRRHPAQEPDQTNRLPKQLPERPHGR